MNSMNATERDLLREAVKEGYFEVPRKTSLVTLAEHHGMTSAEASQCLRRGLDTILADRLEEPTP